MRISDWSSDVCSSDLGRVFGQPKVEVRMIGEQLREEPRPHSHGHDGGHTNAKNTGSGRRSFFNLMMGSLEMRQRGLQARIKYQSDQRRRYAGGASFEHLLTETDLLHFYGHNVIGVIMC